MKKLLIISVFLFLMIPLSLAQDELPSLDELPVGEWSQIDTEGETMCARGAEYKFFVRPADSDKLLVHFQGGGACWDDGSCSVGNAYTEGGRLFKDFIADDEGGTYINGIFDLTNEANPVADYNMVLVSYCSADIHDGNGDMTYTDVNTGEELTVHHRGVVNANAVLDWTFENFEAPSDVFVTGCSAGAYGSIRHVSTIIDAYPDANVAQLGDSGVGGLLSDEFSGFENWNFFETVPDTIADIEDYTTSKHYIAVAQQYPDVHLAQYNTFLDGVQIFFAALTNGRNVGDQAVLQETATEWATDMVRQVNTINRTVDNFDYFTMSGGVHCIVNNPAFYDYEAGDTLLSDWVADLIDGDGAGDVSCDILSGECLVTPEQE